MKIIIYIFLSLSLTGSVAAFDFPETLSNQNFRFEKDNRYKSSMVVDGFLYIDAEDFDDYGGWRMDTQVVHLMGSAFMMATGVGEP